MAAYRRRNMLAGIQGIQGRDRPSRGLSAPLWSRFADRVGVNRVKSLRSKRGIARVRERWCGGGTPPPARPVCERGFFFPDPDQRRWPRTVASFGLSVGCSTAEAFAQQD